MEDAALAQELETDTDIRGFMIDRSYTDAEAVPDIDDEELQAFKDDQLPDLHEMHASPPTYEEWRAEQEVGFGEITRDTSSLEEAIFDMGAIDLMFIFLGIATAFKIVDGRGEPPRKRPERRARRSKD